LTEWNIKIIIVAFNFFLISHCFREAYSMSTTGWLRKYSVLMFLVLTFLLATPILATSLLNVPFELLVVYASWTPNIAAFIVLGLVLREKGGISRLLSGWKKWRVGLKWYLVAFSPVVVALLAVGIYRVLGGEYSPPDQPVAGQLPLLVLFSVITGATGEELGWRGFLLPRLQTRFGPLVATLLTGAVWALWHLPLWFIPGSVWQESIPYWAFALAIGSSSFLYTWVVNNTGGSLVMASIIHFIFNFVSNLVVLFGLIPLTQIYILYGILYPVYAALIVFVFKPSMVKEEAALIAAQQPEGYSS
jgi:membrane protease YdiL (CAAX protease family)